MSTFVCHEPCPRCGSRDNVAVWSDGHKLCFGCGYRVPATRTIKNARPDASDPSDPNPNFDGFSFDLPKVAYAYLGKYGLSIAEIKQYFKYDVVRDLLIHPWEAGDGYSGRYMGPDKKRPRYYVAGDKFSKLRLYGLSSSDTVIVVEDIISAIKVGRQYATFPLFGSTMPAEALKTLVERFSRTRIWLDRDKTKEAALMASKAVLRTGKDVSYISTQLDPKCYTNEQVKRFVDGPTELSHSKAV